MRRIGLIKPGRVVVNVSRGGPIDQVALADAVRNGLEPLSLVDPVGRD